MREFIAHTPDEPLLDHINLVRSYAEIFAQSISSEDWCRLTADWHDLGKYSTAFQEYIQGIHTNRVDHSTAGAQYAEESFGVPGRPLAYCITGHHGGLKNWDTGNDNKGLKQRLDKSIESWKNHADPTLLNQNKPEIPSCLANEPQPTNAIESRFRVSFWIRIMFSCLVDADFLATEQYMSGERFENRPKNLPSINVLRQELNAHLGELCANSQPTAMNIHRASILEKCRNAAPLSPGFFSLCVPTGGGKTKASLAFALDHAHQHGLQRIISAIPFTSIIEQNAEDYRNIFKDCVEGTIIEHHSNLDPDKETEQTRLQCENWDAPLIVTTNVQLLESLFASKTSRCRKLHRIVNSVIILDEVQCLPVELLHPTLLALRELVTVYNCTIVLCSATQPALEKNKSFTIGLSNIRPIISDPQSLHTSMKRTIVEQEGLLDDETLVDRLLEENQVLCIVNTRPHAAAIYEHMEPGDGHIHLSTRMCAEHRIQALKDIRLRLKEGRRCRVVSTQLIEAGVDVDFPIVYRAQCGLDSLTQAAGRCNREGKQKQGRVIYFKTAELPPGSLQQAANHAQELLNDFDDLLSPACIQKYFELHYWARQTEWDMKRVLDNDVLIDAESMQFNFQQISERYKIIEETGESVLIPYGQMGKKLIATLNGMYPPNMETWRRLQRYTIQLRSFEITQLENEKAIIKKHGRWVLNDEYKYDMHIGIVCNYKIPVEDCII